MQPLAPQPSSPAPSPATAAPADCARSASWLGALVVVGIAIYVLLDIIAQRLPPHYNPISQAESDLGVGPYGWIMSLNFVIRGLIALALVAGLRRVLAPAARSNLGLALLVVWAVGDFLLAIFATDVPPHRPTLHGAIHLLVAIIIFVAVAVGELLLALRLGASARWAAAYPVLLAIAIAALLALLATVFHPARAHIDGLVERIFLGLALLWMLVAGIWLMLPRPD